MKKKDWVGGRASVFKTLGASNHAEHERACCDYYATEPKATEWLLKLEPFDGPILEPACGEGHISEVLTKGGYSVISRCSRCACIRFYPRHRQSGVERRHRYKSAVCLCPGVRGEGPPDYPRREESVHVPETDFSGRQEAETPLQYTTAGTGVGQLFAAAVCHERQV